MEINGIGVWSGELRYGAESERRDAAAELEELGYAALWVPDVRAHLDAGADHVCVQVLNAAERTEFPLAEWRALAPALVP